jgi:Na+-driven multidrug efflux pump
VLTSFLLWPVVLACIMPLPFWQNLPTMAGYMLIVGLTCVTTATTALFCSTIFQKSSTSLIATYLIIVAMFMAPVAVTFFAQTFFRGTTDSALVDQLGVMSPFSATFALPLDVSGDDRTDTAPIVGNLRVFFGFIGWSFLYNAALVAAMMRLFQVRWRVAD